MFVIITPTVERLLGIQQAEQACYFSACAEMAFRKHGVISVRGARPDRRASSEFPIVTRLARVDNSVLSGPACVEGPPAPEVAAALRIAAEPRRARHIELLDALGQSVGNLLYPSFTVRQIPEDRGQRCEPYPFVSDDRIWNNRTIRFSRLSAGDPWKPIAFLRADEGDELLPAAISDGRRIVFALPVFDLIVGGHAFPPLNVGYYTHTDCARTFPIELWLIDQLLEHAAVAGIPTIQVRRWPEPFTAALTVRHDYDRPVDRHQLGDLLDFYDALGVKSSWGFLADRAEAEVTGTVTARGHEATLHSEAKSPASFAAELRRLREERGIEAAGYTTHGGVGSAGFLGQTQYQWAVDESLEYGEILGRANHLPHSAIAAGTGLVPTILPLVLQASHRSLDAGTGPEAHNLDRLSRVVADLLRDGGHAVVMNHPDIHFAQLRQLLGELHLAAVWPATFRQIGRWVSAAKLRSRVELTEAGLQVTFSAPLPVATSLNATLGPDRKCTFTCDAGTTTTFVDRS
ncbi:MAG: hypothetical protein JSV91_14055 [Phycisphaerales bacterium]|nr:MAG: hypothetical protein JSV91_14055 [Phycisphaerales bacterium]